MFLKGISGKKLNACIFAAWRAGLKTTYYLRTLGATKLKNQPLMLKSLVLLKNVMYQDVEQKEEIRYLMKILNQSMTRQMQCQKI